MDVEIHPQSWRLPAFSIVLAIIAWLAALASLAYAMGDVNEADPARKIQLLVQHQLISRSSLVLFVTALIGSSWLAGIIFRSSRIASLAVLAIHLAAIFGVIFMVFR